MSKLRLLSAIRVCFCLALLAGLLLLGSCGVVGGLEGRAAQYYNYLIGRYPKQAYSSYLSPAYKKKFSRDDLRQLDESRRKATKPNTRYPLAHGRNVLITSEDKFAWSVVDPALGDAFAVQQPLRWVKVGLNWYIYSGSEAEISAYGAFPATLAPPPMVEFEKQHEAEREKATSRKAKGGKSKNSDAKDEADAEPGADSGK